MLKLNFKHTIYASYFGYITQAIVNNLAPLLFVIFREKFGISLKYITMLIAVNFLVQLFVDMLAARFADKIGYRRSIVSAHIFSALGIIGLAVFPNILPSAYAGLLTATVMYAIGGGLIEVLVSPIVEACPTDNKTAVMSLLHSFYCWGTVAVVLLSAVFLYFFGRDKWYVLPILWSLLPVFNAVFFYKVPLCALVHEDEVMSLREIFGLKIFWIFAVLMVAAGAAEQGMSQWASAFAEIGLGVSKTTGDIAGACMFSVLMGISRVFYAKISGKADLLTFIILSGGLCIAAYCIASFAQNPVIALIGCGLCGLSVGILWPGVFSLASQSCPKGSTALFALLALAGDLGCMGGPALVGAAAALCGDDLKKGIVCAVIFPIILIIFAVMYRKESRIR